MKRILCPEIPRSGHPVTLSDSEANHVLQVFRMRDGDVVEVIDGHGNAITATLRTRGKEAWVEVSEQSVARHSSGEVMPVTLELAVLKGDAMEWAIEKAVELGISAVQPVMTAHTVVQLDRKGPEAFRERWQKIADQALKQCGRLEKMRVELPLPLQELLTKTASQPQGSTRLWCDETSRKESAELLEAAQNFRRLSEQNSAQTLRVLIGPEGGFSVEEMRMLQNAGERVSLGPLVLRAETAAVFAISVLGAALRTKKGTKA